MKKTLLFMMACFCSCGVFKTREKEVFKQDSLVIRNLRVHTIYDNIVERKDSLYFSGREQQRLEIYANAPYHWHPDSGLSGNAGYLRLQWYKEDEVREVNASLDRLEMGIQEKNLEETKVAKLETRLNKVQSPVSILNNWRWILILVMAFMLIGVYLWKKLYKFYMRGHFSR